MKTGCVWNSLEIAKFVATLATPIVVAMIGFRINARLRKLYREDVPHIELKLDCKFHGYRDGKHLTTFAVSAANVGRVKHEFPNIMFRVLGIKEEPFEYDADNEGHLEESARRAAFPHTVLKRNLVPKTKNTKWNFIFVEPGVTQDLSLTTLIPSDYTYLMAHVAFYYQPKWPHTAEAVFTVPQASNA